MTKHKNDAQLYLQMYPKLAKQQVNQCVGCQRQGYKLDHPDLHPNIKKYFDPVALNSDGLFSMCEVASRGEP